MDDELRGRVRRTYSLPGKRLLLLDDDYEGGVESGDEIEVGVGERDVRVVVESVAWGSAISASPPVTLIVPWGDDPDPEAGALVRGVPRRAR